MIAYVIAKLALWSHTHTAQDRPTSYRVTRMDGSTYQTGQHVTRHPVWSAATERKLCGFSQS